MNAFNGDPKSLNGRVVNPENRLAFDKIVRTKLSLYIDF